MKKQWFQTKDQSKTTGKKDDKKEVLNTTINGRSGFMDMVKESQMPLNVHKRQRFEEKKFHQMDTVMTLIISYLLTKESDSNILIKLSHVCKNWQKLTATDSYWRPTLDNYLKTLPENTEKDKKLSNRQLWMNLYKANYLDKRQEIEEENLKKSKEEEQKKKKEEEAEKRRIEREKKLAKTLEPLDPTPFYIKSLADLQDKLLKDQNDEKNIIKWKKNDKNEDEVELASLKKLVEELTSHERYDQHFLQQFMLTFRSFTNKDELFDLLEDRFNIPPPKGISHEEFAIFKRDILDKIRLRVTQSIKYWMENFFKFDFSDKEMIDKLNSFIDMMEKSKAEALAKMLKQTFKNQEEGGSQGIKSEMECPKILQPKKGSFFAKKKKVQDKILEWPSLEIARQITIIEFEMFEKIEPKECLNQSWNKGLRETKAPNISNLISWFNLLSNWIGTVIVKTVDLEDRVKVMEQFIDVAHQLCEINNFNGIFAAISGLALAPVFRLKKTWADINEETKSHHQLLNSYISRDKNFTNIRTAIRSVKPPCIPYIGLYLTDLTFIEDGNPKYIDGLINFEKCRFFANVIRDMQIYQNQRYPLEKCDELYKMLKEIKHLSENEMYEESLKREERGQKKKVGGGDDKNKKN